MITSGTEHRGLPRALVLLIGGACIVVILAGVSFAAWLIGPLFLALMIVIAVNPVPQWLRRHGWPSWLATGLLVVLVYGVIGALIAVLIVSVAQLATLLPTYSDKAQGMIDQFTQWLSHYGVAPAQLKQSSSSIDFGKLVHYAQILLGSLASVGTAVVFLLSLLLFFSMDAATAKLRQAAMSEDRPTTAAALLNFVTGTRRYLIVTTVFGLIVAVLDTIGMFALGIPLALLWGVLAFITNYIPNVGFVIGLLPPALIGLLEGGWKLAIAVIAIYGTLNFVVQSLIQPRFVGNAVGITTTATFVSLVLWSWVLGPIGSILAVPLSLLIKALLVDADPRARWVEVLLGSKPPAVPEPAPPEDTDYEPAPTSAGSR